jgi:hypothetical protein
MYFIHILEVYTNFWNLKENEKSKFVVHSVGPASAQDLTLLA